MLLKKSFAIWYKKKTFLNIKKTFFGYQEIDPNSLLLKIHFLISKNPFLDIKKSISWYQEMGSIFLYQKFDILYKTRGPKGHISCTWVQCATFLADWPGRPSCFSDRPGKHKLGRGRWDLAGVEINTGPLARGQWISCRASRICFALARLASKISKPYFWVDMD